MIHERANLVHASGLLQQSGRDRKRSSSEWCKCSLTDCPKNVISYGSSITDLVPHNRNFSSTARIRVASHVGWGRPHDAAVHDDRVVVLDRPGIGEYWGRAAGSHGGCYIRVATLYDQARRSSS